MSALGKLLREKREALGLSLKDVSTKTRIREYVLEVLEEGRFMELPSYVHVHGFVKQYTESLGLDFADVKKMLDAECRKSEFGRDYREEAETRKREEEAGEGDSNRSTMFIALGAVLLIVVILVIRTMTGAPKETASPNTAEPAAQTEQVVQAAPEPTPADNATAVADNATDNRTAVSPPSRNADNATTADNMTAEASPVQENPADAAAITPDGDNESTPLPVIQEPVNVAHTASLSFTDICWVHINIDGAEDIDFIAQAGETRQIEFVDYFIIDIGNAAAVAITDGNRTHAYFGEYAQPVRNLRFSYNQNDRFIYERL